MLAKYFLYSYLFYDRSIENWYSRKDDHTSSNTSTINQNKNPSMTTGGINLSSPTSILVENENTKDNNMVPCTSPVGSMDGSILVESESGEFSDFTTLQVSLQCLFLEMPVKSIVSNRYHHISKIVF